MNDAAPLLSVDQLVRLPFGTVTISDLDFLVTIPGESLLKHGA